MTIKKTPKLLEITDLVQASWAIFKSIYWINSDGFKNQSWVKFHNIFQILNQGSMDDIQFTVLRGIRVTSSHTLKNKIK